MKSVLAAGNVSCAGCTPPHREVTDSVYHGSVVHEFLTSNWDTSIDRYRFGPAANEEFQNAQAADSKPAESFQNEAPGWNAYAVWHSRIRTDRA
jgi:hypothetical protein